MRDTKILWLVLATSLAVGCGDDDTNTTPIDAPAASIDAPGAADTTYTVTLTKAQETAACAGAGANATGTATVTVSGDNSTITVSNMTYSGLSGAATMAHIHANVAGMNGGVVLAFNSPASPINQTFHAADYTAATGAPANFAAFVTSLKAGGAYLNVHTTACSGGEIRGQIQ
jgi:T5SS/PEP-CTERM-associated repeat protein